MRLCGVSLAALLCVIMMVKVSRSDLEIKVTYFERWQRLKTIGFNNTNIMSFLDCVCNERSTLCYVYLWKPKDYVRNVSSVTAIETITSPANSLYRKMYNCLFDPTYLITCQRMIGSSSTNGKPFIYINELQMCDLHCVGILWSTSQTVTVSNNETGIFKTGSVPEICSSNLITVTTSTMTTTTVTNTTPTVRSTTTKKPSGTSIAIATESAKSELKTSADDNTELPGVTIVTNTNGSLIGSTDVPDSNKSVIVGVTVSFVVLIALILGVFFLIRWRQKQDKETGSCVKPNVAGSLVETSHGTCDSSYSEVEIEKKVQNNVSKYQYSQINSAFISENITHEYLNVKVDPQETKSSDTNPHPNPLEKSDAEIVQSNGGYSLASVSNKQTSPNSKYSIPDNDTEKCKPHKAPQNEKSQISTDNTYANLGMPIQDRNTFAVFHDRPTMKYQLAMNINDTESQNKQAAASLDTTANKQTKDYAVLGDQKRELTNPYNCSFDATSSSIQTLPTDSETSQYNETCENRSHDYCLASSLKNKDNMSQLNSNSNTKGDDVRIVPSEYDLARE